MGKMMYVVSWAQLDGDENQMESGTLGDAIPFRSFEDAHDKVVEDIRNLVKEDMSFYDESEWKDVYDGRETEDEVYRLFVCRDEDGFVLVRNPNTDVEIQYRIVGYSLDGISGETT